MNEEDLFELALQTPPDEIAALLDRECVDLPDLRKRIERLLQAHNDSNLLDNPIAEKNLKQAVADIKEKEKFSKTLDYVRHDNTGQTIGRYTLERLLGEGGMGAVWVAKQTEPVKRRVALKLIKTGMDSREVLSRFDHERQALAVMDHPNIARVIDAGMTSDGRPYFAMELVNGLPLTKFCDEAILSTEERLDIFVQICSAVQHAHQKGIIHRDLKPSNILVTLIDGKPVPKVIDFGVSKALAGNAHDRTLSTQFGAVIGTIEYMAPEQAGYSGTDIDTRADIYALGVILYELLTGLKPFDSQRIRKAAMDEVIRIIREEEPSKPSTRLSSSDSRPSLAAARRSDPARLARSLRGDLDWIALKCLEKDRNRRYETANQLAMEIKRYLCDEPVFAGPPNAAYLIRKFIRRNKRQVIAASSILLALIAGLIVSLWQMNRAILAEQQAVVSRNNESKERQRADEQRELAIKNAELAIEGNRQARAALDAVTDDVMRSLFSKSTSFTENERQFLKRVLGLFDQLTKIEGDTAVAAEFREKGYWKIAEIQLQLGADEDAAKTYQNMRDMFEQQAKLFPDAVWPRQNLVGALRQASIAIEKTGRVDDANKLTNEADTIIAELISKFPNDQGLYYSQLVSRYDRIRRLPKNQQEAALRGFIESFEQHLKKYPDDHMASALKLDTVNLLFDNVNLAENPAEAEKFDIIANKLTEQLSNVPEFSDSDYFLWQKVRVFQHHGGRLAAMGDNQEALDAYRRSIAITTKQMAEKTIQPWQWNEHIACRYLVSELLEKMKLWKESVVELRQAEKDVLQWSKTFPDPEQQLRHQADINQKLCDALQKGGGSNEEVIAALRRAAEFREANLDKFDSPKNNRLYIAHYRGVVSYPLTEAKRYDEALAELQKALRVREELVLDFPDDPTARLRLADAHSQLGYSYFDLNQFLEASLQCQKGVEVYELLAKEFPDDRRYQQGIGNIQHNVGDRYRDKKKFEEAVASYRQASIVRRKLFEKEPENWEYRSALAWTLHNSATVLIQTGRFEDGVAEFVEAVELWQDGRKTSSNELVTLRDWINELDTRAWEMQSSSAQDSSATKRALPVHRRVLEFRKRSADDFPDDPQYLFHMEWSHLNIGIALLNLNQTDAAMNEFRMMTELLERHAVKFPNDMKLRQYFADDHDKIGERLRLAGFPGLGEDMYQVALKARESLAIDFPKEPFFQLQIAWSHFNIGEVRIEAKNESAGVAEMLECFARIDGLCRDGRKLPRVEFDGFVLKICRIFERFKLFEPLADVSTRYIDCVRQVWPDASSPNPEIAGLGGESLLKIQKPAAAEPILRSALGALNAKVGWRYFYGQCLLGESLRAQGKLEEAESLLKEGYEGMKQRRSSIGFVNAPRFRTALEWLVKWAEDSNRSEEVEQWKAELARLDGEASEVNETKSP